MHQTHEGNKVPTVTFRVRDKNEWHNVTTDELFSGKTVVVFSLPGAFTPTCSSTHLPRYNELAPAFLKNGVDAIYCVSVNDTFVMNEWAKEQEAQNIKLIPDGNGEFTAGINPQAKMPDQVAIFTREGCGFCASAKTLLTQLGYSYAEIPLHHTSRSRIVGAVSGEKTVPQIFINGEHIGGLAALEQFVKKAA